MKKKIYLIQKGKEKYVLGLPIHEMNHGYVKPLTEESNLVTNETHIFDTIKEKMKE